jgi:hypothetical protein
VIIESQIQPMPEGGFALVVTISNAGHYWTTMPARLAAATWDEAHAEAAEQLAALSLALKEGATP